MAIKDIINAQPNLQLVINAADLKELFNEWMNEYMSAKATEVKKEDVLLTADEAAAQLHKTKTTLWRWGKVGLLHPVKVGKSVQFWQSDLDKLKQKEG